MCHYKRSAKMNGKFLCFVILASAAKLLFASSSASSIPELEANCGTSGLLKIHYTAEGDNDIECSMPYDLTLFFQSGEPQVTYSGAKEGVKYTLIMADPDAPSHSKPSQRYWLHWLVANIAGSDLKAGTIQQSGTDTGKAYQAPSPPAGSGYHRYFFYLFEQSGIVEARNFANRGRFDIAEFAMVNHLSSDPVALNMFYTKRNDP